MKSALQSHIEKALANMQKNMFQPWDEFPNPSVVPLPEMNSFLKPHVDIEETSTEYHLLVDLPGLSEGNLNVELSGRILHIKGIREVHQGQASVNSLPAEALQEILERDIEFFEDVNLNSIKASYKNGILTIAVEKIPYKPAVGKKIPVEFN